METNLGADKESGTWIKAILRIPLLTMGLWVVLGGLGMLLLPTVDSVVASQSSGSLPAGAPTLKALKKMDQAFGTGRAQAFVFVVFENKDKLSTVDQATYSNLVARFKGDSKIVAEVQDYLGDADKQKALTSADGKSTYLPVGMTAPFGSTESNDQVDWVRGQVKAAAKATGQHDPVYVTGDPASLIDLTRLATKANEISGIVSMVLLFVILLGIYRTVHHYLCPVGHHRYRDALHQQRALAGRPGRHGPLDLYRILLRRHRAWCGYRLQHLPGQSI